MGQDLKITFSTNDDVRKNLKQQEYVDDWTFVKDELGGKSFERLL